MRLIIKTKINYTYFFKKRRQLYKVLCVGSNMLFLRKLSLGMKGRVRGREAADWAGLGWLKFESSRTPERVVKHYYSKLMISFNCSYRANPRVKYRLILMSSFISIWCFNGYRCSDIWRANCFEVSTFEVGYKPTTMQHSI